MLTKGSLIYSGPRKHCISYFEQVGYKLPPFVNPGEFVIDLAALDTRSLVLEINSVARVKTLKMAWKYHQSLYLEKAAKTGVVRVATRRKETSQNSISATLQEIHVLTRRTWKTTWRDRLGLVASIVEALSMGVITGWIFLHLGRDLAGIRSREGALYTAANLQSYLVLLFETYRLTIDIEPFNRERSEGVVSVHGFILSRRLARFWIEDIPVPLIYSVIFYFMAGFNLGLSQLLNFFIIVLLLHFIAVNLAIVCVSVSRNFLTASLIANLAFTLQTVSCGFFINTNNLAIWLRWTKWTAYVVCSP